ALNRADLLQVKGLYPPPPGESELLGLEISGEVVATGPGAHRWKKGDRVCALLAGGGYAELVAVHEDMLMPIPDNLSFEQAAAIPEVFLTAYQVLVYLAKVQKGQRVLIHAGASGVGTAAIQMVRKIGAQCMVTASAGKHERCLRLGADRAVDYNKEDFEEEVLEWTSGEGVEVIVDVIGGSYLPKNLRCLHTDGRLIQLAFMGGALVDGIDLGLILRKRLHLMGSTLRARTLGYKVQLTNDFMRDYWDLFAAGELVPVIDSVYNWREAEAAHEYMASNKNQGKIILVIDGV
ncbi:MAG: NAD(P)H-quinone oxidoreductase, partial [Saprospiraceae bacterium]|nr:NAD(P)H-quinone oxidoreductase [Saprospiraceae bacterium]